ncbi:tetratricopeptide repeat protein [Pseudothermotoga elfii]
MLIKAIVYLPLKPDKAKRLNLPVKLPVLAEDLPEILDENHIPVNIIIRGLEAQYEISKDQYYKSYLIYFYYEKVKEALNENNLTEAEEWLGKVEQLERDYRYDFFKGVILSRSGDYDQAEIFLRSSTSKNNYFALGHYELGNLLRSKKEFEDAILEYKKAFESDKNFLLPLLRIGDCYMEMGEVRQACDFYQTAIQIDPNFAQAYARLGVAYNILQKYDHAENSLRKAVQIDKTDYLSLFNLSFTLSRLGKHFEAMHILKDLVEKKPQDATIMNEYALILRKLGFYEQAKDFIDRAFEINNNDPSLNYNRVLLTLFVDKEEAIRLSEKLSSPYYEKMEDLITFLRQWRPVDVPDFISDKVKKFKPCMKKGEINVQKLVDLLENEDRINMVKNGILPATDTEIDTVQWLDIVMFIILASNDDPIKMEKNVTKVAVSLYGSGIMLAVAITLMRIFLHISAHGNFDLQSFVNDVVTDIQEYHWQFAKRISELENESFSLEELHLNGIKKGSDFLIELLKVLSIDITEEDLYLIEDNLMKEIYLIFQPIRR